MSISSISKVYLPQTIAPLRLKDFLNFPNLLAEVANELHIAFTTCGFVYLVGHGFPLPTMERLMAESRRFFENHTVEQKNAAFPWNQERMTGYNGPNAESLNVLSEEDTQPVGRLFYD